MDRLTEVAKEHYETGAYADCRFVMAAATQRALAAAFPPAKPEPWRTGTLMPLAQFHAIPVLLDNATEPGVWRLLNRSGDEVERGQIAAEVIAA